MARQAGDLSSSRLANLAAATILDAYEDWRSRFEEISRRAPGRFESRDWHGAVADAAERLDLYANAVNAVEHAVRERLADRVTDRLVWAGMKAVYSGLIAAREDWDLAETFFNSVTRRVFATVGVDGNIEFVDSDFDPPGGEPVQSLVRTYGPARCVEELVKAVLGDAWFDAPYEDAGRDAGLAAERLTGHLRSLGVTAPLDRAEVMRAPFFRRKAAYLLGRILAESRSVPFALALLNTERGIVVDAVLTEEDDISVLFSFTWSHFHIDLGPPHRVVRYLKLLMPRKPVAEIYIALGYHKHGKTELYRGLLHHLRESDDRFELAPGIPGMVMVVFTMARYDVVLKVIRDRFPAIKPTTPDGVRQTYRLVFHHDRAGRLVEAQEFEHLEFDRDRFASELLAELECEAGRTAEVTPTAVVLHHAYIERRVTPLDVYLRSAPPDAARAVVADFGQAVKDLAANGIFPGELLPKNFGVTRHSRVVCYDYDELSFLTDFCFRALPEATTDDDDLADESWFGVGPRDVFPEELGRFLGLPRDLRAVLDQRHGDLYQLSYWHEMQARLRSGEVVDIFPYGPSRRLRTT